MDDVAIDYSAVRRQIERVDAGRAVLDFHPAETPAASPWPLLAWPQGAPGKASVHDLQLTLHRPTGTPLIARGALDVQRMPIRFGIDRYRANPHLGAGTHDADGDFSAVGNQNLTEHRGSLIIR